MQVNNNKAFGKIKANIINEGVLVVNYNNKTLEILKNQKEFTLDHLTKDKFDVAVSKVTSPPEKVGNVVTLIFELPSNVA